MKRQTTEDRRQNIEHRTKIKEQRTKGKMVLVLGSWLLALIFTFHFSLVTAAEWTGVDESVIEKYAEEHGRAAREPFINTDKGDLLLFMFLTGGIIGGFAAGYYWRILIEGRTKKTENGTKTQESLAQRGE